MVLSLGLRFWLFSSHVMISASFSQNPLNYILRCLVYIRSVECIHCIERRIPIRWKKVLSEMVELELTLVQDTELQSKISSRTTPIHFKILLKFFLTITEIRGKTKINICKQHLRQIWEWWSSFDNYRVLASAHMVLQSKFTWQKLGQGNGLNRARRGPQIKVARKDYVRSIDGN